MKDFLDLVTKNIPLTALIIIGIILLIIVVAAIVIKVMKPTAAQKENIHTFLDGIKDEIKEKINLTLASTHTNFLDFGDYQAQLIQNINLEIAEHIKDAMDNCISDPKLRRVAYKILTADFVEEFVSIMIRESDVLAKAKVIFDENINDTIENIIAMEEQAVAEAKDWENGEVIVDDFDEENFVDEFTKAKNEFKAVEEDLPEEVEYSDDDETVEEI